MKSMSDVYFPLKRAEEYPVIRIDGVETTEQLDTVKRLFREYETWLNFDLCFQDFETEMQNLPGDYAPPRGRLLLAYDDSREVGCIALRPIDRTTCEMKRLYVPSEFRGRGYGRMLAVELIKQACQIGYESMRLDTVDWMKEAVSLYRSLGFKEIEAYRYNPIEGAIFMELCLDQPTS